ncbi:hypothetical protein [Nocardia panacis]|uniref:hypothetical protein n=1 Tax=Nocardia panacis TaxID=2340916 RepID=UPI0011C38A1A|nr:hypothetical protein [Nocardia panacis]
MPIHERGKQFTQMTRDVIEFDSFQRQNLGAWVGVLQQFAVLPPGKRAECELQLAATQAAGSVEPLAVCVLNPQITTAISIDPRLRWEAHQSWIPA